MLRKKLLYEGFVGRGDVAFLLGAALDSRLCVADGGVRGRELDPVTLLPQLGCVMLVQISVRPYKELKLSMSACE